MADIAKFVEEIKSMTVLELNELVKAIEEEFGVSAAAPVMVAGAGAAAGPLLCRLLRFHRHDRGQCNRHCGQHF